jgi:hypothetical protein
MRRFALALLAIGLLLAACAPTPQVKGGVEGAPATTLSSIPTSGDSTPTATPEQAKPCDASGAPTGSVRLGDLVLWPLELNLAFAQDFALPDGLPDKPLSVTIKDNTSYLGGTRVLSMPVAGA